MLAWNKQILALNNFRKSCQYCNIGSKLILELWCGNMTQECDVEMWYKSGIMHIYVNQLLY